MTRTYIACFSPSKTSNIQGYVLFEQPNRLTPVHITFQLGGFKKVGQIHAIHIHEFGDLRKGCESLGGHWNPRKKFHGSLQYDEDHHAGDLINNLRVQSGQQFVFSYDDPLVTLFGRHSILGRSVVIHQGQDDLGRGPPPDSQITGNAGKRLACAVIGYAQKKIS